jgi:hypothetical protein
VEGDSDLYVNGDKLPETGLLEEFKWSSELLNAQERIVVTSKQCVSGGLTCRTFFVRINTNSDNASSFIFFIGANARTD